MANINEEAARAQYFRDSIVNATTTNEAVLHAFDGLGTLLHEVLLELRELREKVENA